MIDSDEVRQKLVEVLEPAFSAAHPNSPINYENQPIAQDDVNGWIYVSVIPGKFMRKNIGSRNNTAQSASYCLHGIMQVQMAIQKDKGTRKLHQFADTLSMALVDQDWSIPNGRLLTKNADRRTRGVIEGTFAMNFNLEWEYHVTLS